MTKHRFNVGKWLPSDQEFENKWLKKVYKEAESEEKSAPLATSASFKGFD